MQANRHMLHSARPKRFCPRCLPTRASAAAKAPGGNVAVDGAARGARLSLGTAPCRTLADLHPVKFRGCAGRRFPCGPDAGTWHAGFFWPISPRRGHRHRRRSAMDVGAHNALRYNNHHSVLRPPPPPAGRPRRGLQAQPINDAGEVPLNTRNDVSPRRCPAQGCCGGRSGRSDSGRRHDLHGIHATGDKNGARQFNEFHSLPGGAV